MYFFISCCIDIYITFVIFQAFEDNGPENSVLLYKLLKRLGAQMFEGELQRKRSYWKQCAFNAVSCFGK